MTKLDSRYIYFSFWFFWRRVIGPVDKEKAKILHMYLTTLRNEDEFAPSVWSKRFGHRFISPIPRPPSRLPQKFQSSDPEAEKTSKDRKPKGNDSWIYCIDISWCIQQIPTILPKVKGIIYLYLSTQKEKLRHKLCTLAYSVSLCAPYMRDGFAGLHALKRWQTYVRWTLLTTGIQQAPISTCISHTRAVDRKSSCLFKIHTHIYKYSVVFGLT